MVRKTRFLGREVVVKERIKKAYRNEVLDKKLRKERTRSEAKLLHKAKIAGVRTPIVFEVNDFSIVLEFIKGIRPSPQEISKEAAVALAKLHHHNIIHGDFTPANFLISEDFYVIDFGLGFVSSALEDKAMDVFTLLKSGIEESVFWKYYDYDKERVKRRVEKIKERVRYAF